MLRKAIHSLYYILFFVTPLVMFARTSEIFEFNKIIFIYIITLLIAGVWLVKFITQDKKSVHLTPIHWAVLAFVFAQVLSTIFSIDHHTSFFGYYGRFNGGLLSTFAYATLFFILLSEANLPFIKKLLKVSLFSSLVVMLWGLPGKFNMDLTCGLFTGSFNNDCWTNQFQPAERMFSTLGQPNWLGAYIAVHLFIGVYFYLQNVIQEKKAPVQSVFYFFYILLATSTVLFTRSRSSIIAVLISLVLLPLFVLIFRKRDFFIPLLKKIAVLFLFLLIPLLIFKTGSEKIDKFLPFNHKAPIQTGKISQAPSKPVENLNITDSFDIRKIVWKGAWNLALRYPLFGTGVETFAYSYYFTRPIEHNATSEWDYLYNKAHNEYINYLATTGFVGLATYLTMIIAFMYIFIKRLQWKGDKKQLSPQELVNYQLLCIAVFLSFTTILVTNFFGFSTTTISVLFYSLPAVFFIRTFQELKDEPASTIPVRQKIAALFASLSIFIAVFFVLSYWVADMQYADSQSKVQAGHYSEAAYKLLHTLKYHYEHVYEDKLAISLMGTALSTQDKKDADKLIFMAEYYNQKALSASPYNVLYWKSRANIFYNIYQLNSDTLALEKAFAAIKTAQKLAPTDPRLPYSASMYAFALFDAEKKQAYLTESKALINTALQLKPDYEDALVFKKGLGK